MPENEMPRPVSLPLASKGYVHSTPGCVKGGLLVWLSTNFKDVTGLKTPGGEWSLLSGGLFNKSVNWADSTVMADAGPFTDYSINGSASM